MATKKRVQKKVKTRHLKKKFFFSIGIIVLIVVMIVSLSGIVVQIYDKYQELHAKEEQLLSLEEAEAKLNSEINRLKDADYLARYAREKYFFSKEGEIIIRLPENE